MANLTINVDTEVLEQARIRALEENTSVNTVLGSYLREYARAWTGFGVIAWRHWAVC